VQFSKSGLITTWNGGATSLQTATAIALTAPDAITGINAKLSSGASISGTVTDADNAPLPEASVILFNSYGTLVTNTNADLSGNYSIIGLASGTYYLEFLTSGMPPVWYVGATTRVAATPITVSAPMETSGINGQLGVGGSISGSVTNAENIPQNYAQVTLYNSAGSVVDWGWGSTNTDASGNYSFRGLASGTYYIKFSESGMLTAWYGGKTQQTATPITVISPNATTGINGQLENGGSISGTVRDAANNPLPDVSLNLFNSTGSNVAYGYTDTYGNYSIAGLESGMYYLNCNKIGFPPVWYGGGTTQQMVTPINVTVPNVTTGINVQMGTAGGGSISGTVTGADNNPIAGVSVSPYDSSGNGVPGIWASTDSSGYYSLSGLASGTYYIQFYPSVSGMPPIWYGGATSQQTATPITVTAPDATNGINGQMGVGGSISGTVTNPTNIPLRGIHVSLCDSAGDFYLGVDTDSAGNYSFSGLPSGMYYIQFNKTGMPPVWYRIPIIVTSPNAITGINGVMLAGGSIRGTVTDAFNTPLANARVTLSNTVGDSIIYIYTDNYGNYMVSGIADGTYYLKFSANGMQPVWYGGTANWQAATPIIITASSALTGINGQMGVGGSISGTVFSAANSFLSFVRVNLYNLAGSQISMGRADQNGNYSFSGLSSGTYFVQFSMFDRTQAIWYGGATWQTATPIDVTAPDATSGINVTYGGFDGNWIDSQIYGTGSGTVTSSPVGISCMKDNTAGCSVPFSKSETVTLIATPDSTSTFSGWSVDCSGTSTCSLDMSSAHFLIATFSAAPKAKIGDTGYITLNFAYRAVSSAGEIHVLDTVLAEDINIADEKTVTIKGGYNADYGSRSGNHTVLSGTLTIQNGKLTVDGLTIR
jgi:hypothetical protein